MGSKLSTQDLNKSKMVKAVRTHKGSVSNIKFHEKLGLFSTAGLNVPQLLPRTVPLLPST